MGVCQEGGRFLPALSPPTGGLSQASGRYVIRYFNTQIARVKHYASYNFAHLVLDQANGHAEMCL